MEDVIADEWFDCPLDIINYVLKELLCPSMSHIDIEGLIMGIIDNNIITVMDGSINAIDIFTKKVTHILTIKDIGLTHARVYDRNINVGSSMLMNNDVLQIRVGDDINDTRVYCCSSNLNARITQNKVVLFTADDSVPKVPIGNTRPPEEYLDNSFIRAPKKLRIGDTLNITSTSYSGEGTCDFVAQCEKGVFTLITSEGIRNIHCDTVFGSTLCRVDEVYFIILAKHHETYEVIVAKNKGVLSEYLMESPSPPNLSMMNKGIISIGDTVIVVHNLD